MQLREVKVLFPPKAQSEAVQGPTLRLGENGILALTLRPDLTVAVTGARSSYLLWPANVAWAEPLPDEPKALLSSLVPGAAPSPTFSAIAQLAERVTVNDGDVGSTPACGAVELTKNNLADSPAPLGGSDGGDDASKASSGPTAIAPRKPEAELQPAQPATFSKSVAKRLVSQKRGK